MACGRKIHGPGKMEQGGFPAAAAADQGDKFPALDAERKTADGVNRLAIRQVVFRNVLQREYGHAFSWASDLSNA